MSDNNDERRELEAAGWRSKECAGEAVWQNPKSGYWYPQGVAIAMLREGANAGEVPKEVDRCTAGFSRLRPESD